MGDDIQQLLADTWTVAAAARIAQRVAWPGNRGHIVRAVQADAADTHPIMVAMIDEGIAIELHREFGVDVDHGGDVVWQALDDVFDQLRAKWADGGHLPTVATADRAAALEAIAGLSMKAAERVGCEITGQTPDYGPWVPLEVGGQILVDLDGLDAWLTHARRRRLPEVAADQAAADCLRQWTTDPHDTP